MPPPSPTTPVAFPVSFGRYQLHGLLGEGGMARVFLAELRGPAEFRKAVAIKVVHSELAAADDRLRSALLREARIGGLLKHPNIVDIYDFGEEGGQPWIAMELIEGVDLGAWIAHYGPPPPAVVLEIGIAICSGLIEAHDLHEDGRPANLIHRDLKPSNVLLSRLGEVKLMDFGIARAPGIVDSDTRTGMVRGTPRYLSPEQAMAEPLDRRSDLFSVGLILYELAVGRPFLDQPTVTSVLTALLRIDEMAGSPGSLDMLDECVPGLTTVVRRCLRRAPDERFADAREIRHALEGLRAELGPTRHSLREYLGPRADKLWSSGGASRQPPSLSSLGLSPSRGFRPRRRALAAVGLGLLAALAVVGGWWILTDGGSSGPTSRPGLARPAEAPPRVQSRVLVRGEAEVREPSLSPDGSQVVFLRRVEGGSEIVLRHVDGSGERVLSMEPGLFRAQPSFSPDGTRIALSRGQGLYVMALDGGEPHKVSDSGAHADWSPDGTQLAFTTEAIYAPDHKTTRSGLWVVDVASRRTREVYEGDANMPDWAPGGERIAFWGVGEGGQRVVYTIAAAGGEPVAVTSGEAMDWNPRWSPDGRHLYFLSDRAGSSALWRVAIEEPSGRPLGPPQPLTTGGLESPGFLSTDASGRRWVYHTSDPEQNLYIAPLMSIDGGAPGEPVQLTRGARQLTSAALSPDGTQVAFTEQTEQLDVYVMGSDGTGQVRLTDDPHWDEDVAWSPDGTRVAFHSNRDGVFRAWTIRPDGTDLRPVTTGEAAKYPIWAPDGRRLVVADYLVGTASIVHLDEAGTEVSREQLLLPRLASGLYSPTSWSPDGRRILVTRHGDDQDDVLVYDVGSGEHAILGLPTGASAFWLDDDTLVVRQRVPDRFVELDWPDGVPVTRYELPDDHKLWWWLTSPDGKSLVLVLHLDRTALWMVEIE